MWCCGMCLPSLMQLVVTVALAAGLSPCVLQRICYPGNHRPPSTVCMHKNMATMACKNCIILGKEEKAMFRTHSDACMGASGVDQRLVDAMLAGELIDEPPLRKHVYCILLKCKLITKDGKLLKNAVLGKMASRPDAKNVTKVLEICSEQTGDTPENLAWNLFRCGYDKKALLFAYMPTTLHTVSSDSDNNSQ